ncbi:hypothetical protein CKS_1181 [Pantoea stewartii subsp. stewartii DC283]|uniref:Uncharacterized protein n=1 Tax=Pantoea stewartii subsp. stewartii DC283 TaxID=660596 RepID=H3RI90_PANSE|nr:hypothetical protein CKS_1181 [Pantoea stewartii subsp. stewartii DC283]
MAGGRRGQQQFFGIPARGIAPKGRIGTQCDGRFPLSGKLTIAVARGVGICTAATVTGPANVNMVMMFPISHLASFKG